MLGIHGDPVETRRRLDGAKRDNEDLGPNPYGYKRAFGYSPTGVDRRWIERGLGKGLETLTILDPTSGGGSIPIEAHRVGYSVWANDLNPVAALILMATIEWPLAHGPRLLSEFQDVADEFIRRAEAKYDHVFHREPEDIRIEG